jgi:SAM-dependent methyltransferase
LDLAFPTEKQKNADCVIADSRRLPLTSASADVVVCNHTFEHFERVQEALGEVDRVIRPGGYLWASIPNGFSFDDFLYRFTFEGGGHVNRFSLASFVHLLESNTSLRLRHYKNLYSGFVYLNPPAPDRLPHYPRRARRMLAVWRPSMLRRVVMLLNYLTRLVDRFLPTHLSLYGWGFTFQHAEGEAETRVPEVPRLEEDINVCHSCGAGHPEARLKAHLRHRFIWTLYSCPSCGQDNFFFRRRRIQAKRKD